MDEALIGVQPVALEALGFRDPKARQEQVQAEDNTPASLFSVPILKHKRLQARSDHPDAEASQFPIPKEGPPLLGRFKSFHGLDCQLAHDHSSCDVIFLTLPRRGPNVSAL